MGYSLIKERVKDIIGAIYNRLSLQRLLHKGKVIIITYHRVLPKQLLKKRFYQPGIYVEQENFKKQIDFLLKNYHIITFSNFIRNSSLSNFDKNVQYCIITFDDGWIDNYQYAYPILKKRKVPATIFLCASYIGTSRFFWPDDLIEFLTTANTDEYLNRVNALFAAAKKLRLNPRVVNAIALLLEKQDYLHLDTLIEDLKDIRTFLIQRLLNISREIVGHSFPEKRSMLNWQEINEMADHYIEFGSHGCNHEILTLLEDNELRNEIFESKRIIEYNTKGYSNVFCFPNGNFNNRIIDHVINAGYDQAVTVRHGINNFSDGINHFGLKRINIHNDITRNITRFNLHLSGITKKL